MWRGYREMPLRIPRPITPGTRNARVGIGGGTKEKIVGGMLIEILCIIS